MKQKGTQFARLPGMQFMGHYNVHSSMFEHPEVEHIEMRPIGSVPTDPNVPADKQWANERGYMEDLQSEIHVHGFKEPLRVHEGSLVEGTHRLNVARKLGHTHVPVIET